MTRILFPLHGLANWNGGVDFARYLINGLHGCSKSETLGLIVALPQLSLPQRLVGRSLRMLRLLQAGGGNHLLGAASSQFDLAATAREATSHLTQHACGTRGKDIVRLAHDLSADIVFPTMTPLGPASIPRIGYLFDFQHRHLPHLFSARLRRKRDRNFSKLAKDADGIVVNSRSVADDAIRFLGVAAEDMLVLPFSPYVQDWWFQTDPVVVRDRYGLPSRFLLICNHFWTHKDHATAIRAFARLHADSACRDMQLVMTGDPIDHRDPAHFSRLQRLVGELGIASSTRFLGLIPKHEQIALMRGCSLLIQPTLFEGGPGGGSVYEAVGLGVPALVSDIPVNREIDAPNVRFFRAGDDRALAEATFAWLQALPPAADRLQLIEASDARLALMGSLLAGFLIDRATRGRVGTT